MNTPDDLRRIAKEALQATRDLETAVDKGDIDLVKQALARGAVPEWGTYPNIVRGNPTGSVLGRCLQHKNLKLFDLLIEAGAPIRGGRGETFITTAIVAGFEEALERVAHLIEPTDQHITDALKACTAVEDIEARSPLHLLKALSRMGATLYEDHLLHAAFKGYQDVLMWMIEEAPSLRIPSQSDDDQNDPGVQHWLSTRPTLHVALLAHQEALDLERKTQHATGPTIGRRM